jgi:peptide deformylase
MALLPIIETPDPRLKTISSPVDPATITSPEFQTLIDDMFETMYAAPGIGLAAIQVAIPKRLLVMDLQEPDESDPDGKAVIREPHVFINPVILEESDDGSIYNEGCLSVPEIYAEVMRPAEVKVRWYDRSAKMHEQWITGMLATCLQHEMDHLEGILFIDHLSKLKRDMALKKLAKLRKAA